jgi:hypothetical protein
MPEYVTIQLQRPRESFVGRVEEGWFTVRGQMVILTKRDGDPLSKIAYRQKLASEGEDPRQIAQRLLREWHAANRGEDDFSQPIDYPDRGWR